MSDRPTTEAGHPLAGRTLKMKDGQAWLGPATPPTDPAPPERCANCGELRSNRLHTDTRRGGYHEFADDAWITDPAP